MQEISFHCAKELLTLPSILVHFDPTKQLLLACDASPYGAGVVLSQVMDDGFDKLYIAFTHHRREALLAAGQEGSRHHLREKRFLLGRHFTI